MKLHVAVFPDRSLALRVIVFTPAPVSTVPVSGNCVMVDEMLQLSEAMAKLV